MKPRCGTCSCVVDLAGGDICPNCGYCVCDLCLEQEWDRAAREKREAGQGR